jgi:FkbM family methyltransferase
MNRIFQRIREHGLSGLFWRRVWSYYAWRHERRKNALAQETPPPAPALVRLAGQEFELHPSMKGLSENLALYGVHEPLGTSAYLRQLRPGDHVIDIGANLGYFLLLAGRAVGPAGRLLGIEPVPANFEILQRNIRRSALANIELHPWAMGARSEHATFYQSEVPNWGSLVQHEKLLPKSSYTVEVKRLDDVVAALPDFRPAALRMDLDGGEQMVLEGAWETLREFRPALFIELHPFALGWDAIRGLLLRFRDLGYAEGIVIERTWDHPWMGKWVRERRQWSMSLDELLRRFPFPNPQAGVFGLVLRRPGAPCQ